MNIVFYPREGYMETCEAVDTTSSPSIVYLRKNIRREERQDDQGTVEFWKYDEAELTPEDYAEYLEIASVVEAVNSDTEQILETLLGGAA